MSDVASPAFVKRLRCSEDEESDEAAGRQSKVVFVKDFYELVNS